MDGEPQKLSEAAAVASLGDGASTARFESGTEDNATAQQQWAASSAPTTQTQAQGLSSAHRSYLLSRHGTVDLDPLPSASPDDPHNWRHVKKVLTLVLVACHAFMSTFSAACVIPAYAVLAEDLGVTIPDASYLTSVQIIVIGLSPLLWRPLANTYGRRPIFLLSLLCSALFNIACAKSQSYAEMMVFRGIVAFFISPATAIGSAVVSEMFFRRERARYIGVWIVMVTLGVPVAPLIFGFVTQRVGWPWIYWVLAIVNATQFVLWFFFGSETLYFPPATESDPPANTNTSEKAPRKGLFSSPSSYFSLRRINPRPLAAADFVEPLQLAVHPCVVIPAAAYAMMFLFGSVCVTVEIPQLLQVKFDLDAQELGLQFIGIIIGSLAGEQVGGRLSDHWMGMWKGKTPTTEGVSDVEAGNRDTNNTGPKQEQQQQQQHAPPEWRLWLAYVGFALTIVGMIVFLVMTQKAPAGHWTVVPVIGSAIAAAGNQIVTTVLVTYAIDCCGPARAASVGVFITLVRQAWGFVGPFWFPPMFNNVGVAKSSGVVVALLVGVSVIPTIILQWAGPKWR